MATVAKPRRPRDTGKLQKELDRYLADCAHGGLTSVLGLRDLLDFLLRLTVMQPGTLIKDALTKNVVLKFFSLLLALTLWFFVMGEKKAEFSFADVPIEFINKSADLVVTQQSVRSVKLGVSGSRSLLTTLSSNSLRSVIDLEGIGPGRVVFNDLIDTVQLPGGTKITLATTRGSSLASFCTRVRLSW